MTTNPEARKQDQSAGWLRLIALVLTGLVVTFLVRSLLRDGPAALDAWRAANVRWSWMSLALLGGFLGHLVFVIGWQRLLTDFGIRISFGQAARIFFVSNLGRYLPGGKAWQMGIVGVMATEDGLPAATLAATSLVQGLIGAAVGAVLLLATGGATLHVAPLWFALPIAGIAGLLAAPALLRAVPRMRALIVGRLPGLDSITMGTMWALVWTAAASWIAWGFGLYALALGLLPDAGASLMAYLAAWIGPFLAGLIAVVTPAGLGVRDEVMRAMLSSSGVLPSAAMMVALVARVWATALEVVPAVVLLVARRGFSLAILRPGKPAVDA